MYAKLFKRPIDFILSLLALIVLSPVLLLLTIIGAIEMKGNPFFTQERPGRNEKIFKLIKFRSMTNEKDKDGELLPDNLRLNLPRYNKHQARRHEVRPGFTGLAQVSGRNAISWEEKFDLDVEYVDNITFLGDWKIIFRTIAVVLKHDGISSENCATMEEFMGCSDAHGAFESDS